MAKLENIFAPVFPSEGNPISLNELKALELLPDAASMQTGFQLVCEDIPKISPRHRSALSIHFSFIDSDRFNAWSYLAPPSQYLIGFNIGLYKRLVALFRQLALTNAFGKYSPLADFDRDALANLKSIPDMDGFRKEEIRIPVDTLLGFKEEKKIDGKMLQEVLSRTPIDDQHSFDIHTLVTPALVFAFWHELAHILMGHNKWLHDYQGTLKLSECTRLAERQDENEDRHLRKILHGMEYLADEFAASRVAGDILHSVHDRQGSLVLDHFWFGRERFETFVKEEGRSGEKIDYSLEAFLYRVAYAIYGLVLQMYGFFQEPVTDRFRYHPHPEVRVARIFDAVWHHLGGGPSASLYDKHICKLWANASGYALHTAELALSACGATMLPIKRDSRLVGGMFHLQEIQARARTARRDVQAAIAATDEYQYSGVLSMFVLLRGFYCLLPIIRNHLIELWSISEQLPSGRSNIIQETIPRVKESQESRAGGNVINDTDDVMVSIRAFVEAKSWEDKKKIVKSNRKALLCDSADFAMTLWIKATADRMGNDSPAVRHLMHCKKILVLCRKKGVDTVFDVSTRLMELLTSFIGAGTWTECRRIVEANRDLLLTEPMESAFAILIEDAAVNGDTNLIDELRQHQELLECCREAGIEAAFVKTYDLRGEIFRSRNIVQAVKNFLYAKTWKESREIVEEHSDLLLSEDADEVFVQLLTINHDKPGVVSTLKTHRELLARCRKEGIKSAFKNL